MLLLPSFVGTVQADMRVTLSALPALVLIEIADQKSAAKHQSIAII
jgi:hypothetical protein